MSRSLFSVLRSPKDAEAMLERFYTRLPIVCVVNSVPHSSTSILFPCVGANRLHKVRSGHKQTTFLVVIAKSRGVVCITKWDIKIVKRILFLQRPNLFLHLHSARRSSTLQLPKHYDPADLACPSRAPGTMQEINHIPRLVNNEYVFNVG